MQRSSLVSAFVIAFLAGAHFAGAQKLRKEPRRPALIAGADTNDARAYYAHGLSKIERDPEEAGDAFYWAMRINPTFADAYYARRCALLLTDRIRFQQYMEDDRGTLRSDEIKRIDSLYYFSLTINPFMYRGLDARLFRAYLLQVGDDYARRNNLGPGEVQFAINRWLMDASPSFKAWRAYGDGRFPDALRLYAEAIKDAKFKAELRADRGRLFFQVGEADSALTELTQAVDELRKADKKDLVYVYESKALLEHSIGLVQQRLGNKSAAKEAFGRALQEDLSYFPAHVQLAYLALDGKDTTTALGEMDLAVQIRTDDPVLRYIYGYALATSGKYPEAEAQLRKAIEVDGAFAAPYHVLGLVLDGQAKGSEALAQYRSFLARASQSDARRKETEERVRELAIKDDR